MKPPFYLDTETFSPVDIKNGLDNYSRAAEVMIYTYADGDDPVKDYDVTTGARMPNQLEDALLDERRLLIAHNAQFDRTVIGVSGYQTGIERWHCTMVQALSHSLPGALEKLGDIFNIGEDKAKIKDGKALIRLFCCPRPKNMKLRRATKETHPQEWKRFIEYARNDISAMREIHKLMPKWNYGGTSEVATREMKLWHMDQRMNLRGVAIDTDLINGAIVTAGRVKEALAERTVTMTDGALNATTQRDALLTLLRNVYDIELVDLRGSTIETLLKSDHDLPDIVVELLENRLAASSTSVSKYKRFAQLTGPDGRLRNTTQFCGAMRTGRDAGRGVQLQNLPRPALKQKEIDSGIESIKLDCLDLVDDFPMTTLSSAIRGGIVASPGTKLTVADLSNIEGRMLAFLAGEEWKLQAFRDYDTCRGVDGEWYTGDELRDAVLADKPIELKLDKKGEPTRKGYDLYALAYAKAFRITPEAVMENKKSGDGSFRQIGKVMELALGYEGGVGAFVTFAVAYGIDLDAMARAAIGGIPAETLRAAEKAYKGAVSKKRDYNMLPETYTVCDSFKRLWREAHPNVAEFWKELEIAFRRAIEMPGKVFTARKISVVKNGNWVRLVLPSGRSLCYPSPKITDGNKVSYMGLNQFSRQWCRLNTYSGKLAENVTQAASRDVFKAPVGTIVAAGYAIEIPVHDELITETPDDSRFSAEHLAALMSDAPAWAMGLPLAAAGFESYRYRKD
jgi:DNA polymerase